NQRSQVAHGSQRVKVEFQQPAYQCGHEKQKAAACTRNFSNQLLRRIWWRAKNSRSACIEYGHGECPATAEIQRGGVQIGFATAEAQIRPLRVKPVDQALM